MRNKIRLIDVSILSTYMGRWLSAIVTAVVLGITVSAILSGGSAEHNIIDVCVPAVPSEREALRVYEPFRELLGEETRRPVVLFASTGEWNDRFDLYIMPARDYFRLERSADIVALFEVKHWSQHRDNAAIISKVGDDVDLSRLRPGDIAFEDRESVNGFLLQLSLLEERGFSVPERLEGLRFEGGEGGASRVIFGVLHGQYRVGACRMSELLLHLERGDVRPGEIRIVDRREALPELIIASRRSDARYYQRKLSGVGASLAEISQPSTRDATVELLKSFGIKGLRPVTEEQMEAARQLFEKYVGRI